MFGNPPKSGPVWRNRATILGIVLEVLSRKKSSHDFALKEKSGHNFAVMKKKQKRIFSMRFVPNFKGFYIFIYKYISCIR